MTQAGSVYGEALYSLAKEEQASEEIRSQLQVLKDSFTQEPDFLKLLGSPSLTKAERCQVLETSFRGMIHDYLLNFLKILTEKGYIRYFSDCCEAYTQLYNEDHGILPVTAVTAVAMSGAQQQTLREKLSKITGKQIELHCRIDAKVLGGVRLDYQGQRLDDTVQHRLDAIRDMLKNTVL